MERAINMIDDDAVTPDEPRFEPVVSQGAEVIELGIDGADLFRLSTHSNPSDDDNWDDPTGETGTAIGQERAQSYFDHHRERQFRSKLRASGGEDRGTRTSDASGAADRESVNLARARRRNRRSGDKSDLNSKSSDDESLTSEPRRSVESNIVRRNVPSSVLAPPALAKSSLSKSGASNTNQHQLPGAYAVSVSDDDEDTSDEMEEQPSSSHNSPRSRDLRSSPRQTHEDAVSSKTGKKRIPRRNRSRGTSSADSSSSNPSNSADGNIVDSHRLSEMMDRRLPLSQVRQQGGEEEDLEMNNAGASDVSKLQQQHDDQIETKTSKYTQQGKDEEIAKHDDISNSKYDNEIHTTTLYCGMSKSNLYLVITAVFIVILVGVICAVVIPSSDSPKGDVVQGDDNDDSARLPNGDNETVLIDIPSTPQSLAREWMRQDILENNQNQTYPMTRSQTRYSLAVLYYSTTNNDRNRGVGWNDEYNFLSSKHECDWYATDSAGNVLGGVICNTLEQVTGLLLGSNNLVGSLPATELKILSNLEVFHVHDNFLTGMVPGDLISGLPLLESFDVSNNVLSGTLSTKFGQLSKLHTLKFDRNKLDGSIPTELGSLYHVLQHVSGYENSFTGSFPWDHFIINSSSQQSSTITLSNVYMGSNHITGQLPTDMTAFSKITSIFFDDNLLQGTISDPFLLPLQGLVYLDLSNNNFDDGTTIPTSVGVLTGLRELRLSGNRLNGAIPAEIANCSDLEILELSSNYFVGTIPTVLGTLEKLISFDLSTNQLEGTVPTELGNLRQLTSLGLSVNFLTGTVPTEFVSLSSLQTLRIYQTELTGDVSYLCSVLNNGNNGGGGGTIEADCANNGFGAKVICSESCCSCQ